MSQNIEEAVRTRYGTVAVANLSSEQEGVRAVAEAFGYTAEELQSIPAEANMGLSCGNPTATANLREGETVVDLGSGGGLDVFLAAAKVGTTGRAIGIDMTPEMVELARRNAAKANDGAGYSNVEFHFATIDNQSGCCSPAMTQISAEPRVSSGGYACCAPVPAKAEEGLFDQFTELLARYNVNDYAASVKVFAIK